MGNDIGNAPGSKSGHVNYQRNLDRRLQQGVLVPKAAFAKHFAMVGREDNDRVFIKAGLLERSQNPANLVIDSVIVSVDFVPGPMLSGENDLTTTGRAVSSTAVFDGAPAPPVCVVETPVAVFA